MIFYPPSSILYAYSAAPIGRTAYIDAKPYRAAKWAATVAAVSATSYTAASARVPA
jgi:hypothetical protein